MAPDPLKSAFFERKKSSLESLEILEFLDLGSGFWLLEFWVRGLASSGFGVQKAQGPDLAPDPLKQAFFERKKSSFGEP